jgi:hypothetical protein
MALPEEEVLYMFWPFSWPGSMRVARHYRRLNDFMRIMRCRCLVRCCGTKVWLIAFTITPRGASMSFHQPNPSIPVTGIGKGDGDGTAVIDNGQEHNLIWGTALDETAEVWCAPNPLVSMKGNWTMGREWLASVSLKGSPSDKVKLSSGQIARTGRHARTNRQDLCSDRTPSQAFADPEPGICRGNLRICDGHLASGG